MLFTSGKGGTQVFKRGRRGLPCRWLSANLFGVMGIRGGIAEIPGQICMAGGQLPEPLRMMILNRIERQGGIDKAKLTNEAERGTFDMGGNEESAEAVYYIGYLIYALVQGGDKQVGGFAYDLVVAVYPYLIAKAIWIVGHGRQVSFQVLLEDHA